MGIYPISRILVIALLLAMLLPLCACAGGRQSAAEQGEASAPPACYLSVEMGSSFPLGLDARVQGIAATETCVFIGGAKNDAIALARMEYSLAEDSLSLGSCDPIPLPDYPAGTQLLGLSCAAGEAYALLGMPEEEDGPFTSYMLSVYDGEGNLVRGLTPEYTGDESPLSILAMEDGSFCLRGIHHLNLYSPDGALIIALTQERQEFYPPLLLDGRLVIWLRDPETGLSTLNALDAESASLQPLQELTDIGAPNAYMQSVIGAALVSNGSNILRINTDYTVETVLEWYPLTGDYGHHYRYICQLDENVFLVAAKDSGEVKQMVLACRPEDRKLIRLGFYGLPEYTMNDLLLRFSQYNPGYRVEAVDYGCDADSLTRLLAEITSEDKLDILVSSCDAIEPSSAFVDLYEWIDRDAELSREDFLPVILNGLEKDGKLRQIWNGFAISTPTALGPLAEGPSPLRLADCQSYLDGIGYEGILFHTGINREDLFNLVSDSLLADAYQEETGEYCLDRSRVRELVELCRTRPAEEAAWETLTEKDQSQVLETAGPYLAYLNSLEEERQPYRLFDGTDGGDNLIRLHSIYGNCFMIPATCADPQNAWGFLRTMLLPGTQLKSYEAIPIYPSNAAAFNTVMESCAGSQTRAVVNTLLEKGHVCNYDAAQLRKIFFRCLEPCLYGDYDLDMALDNAEGRMNLYAAEHMA